MLRRAASLVGPLLGLVVTFAACSSADLDAIPPASTGDDAGGPSPECAGDGCADGGAPGSGDGAAPDGAAPGDGASDASADAAPVCGEAAGVPCADGEPCAAGADCASGVCGGGTCSAPTTSDGVANGGETDVDCGGSGSATPRCAAGKKCGAGSDCASETCRVGVCAHARSCAQVNGGATCGPGEVGDPNAKHEDCCIALEVPRPAASGGPFKMDKYLITAGRMRAFLEAVDYDVRGWITNHRPAWWTGTGTSTWDAMLPTNADEFLSFMTTGGSGCYIGPDKGQSGAPAFWAPGADLARVVGGAPRTYTQAELDTKVMNCFRAPLFHALCAYDGGRLPSRDEWIAARTVGGAVRPYPWGSDGTDADRRARAAYDFDYAWPSQPGANDNDLGGYLPAPGRFPLGNGPYGHADLLGSVENMGSQPAAGGGVKGDGWFQFSFQEPEIAAHPYGQQYVGFGTGAYRNHWAVGARCVKLP